jgi:hypothetical protein
MKVSIVEGTLDFIGHFFEYHDLAQGAPRVDKLSPNFRNAIATPNCL